MRSVSLKRHTKAHFLGWEGPTFPKNIRQLATAYDVGTVNGQCLEEIGNKIPWFSERSREESTDGYTWFWLLDFALERGQSVRVAFPWAQDFDREDNSQLDRSPAVYTGGSVSGDQMNAILEQLIRHLKSHR